jgi:prepilin-type processing-associated H-X9-DG protein
VRSGASGAVEDDCMTEIRPTAVTADRNERTLSISWADGHVSRYSFDGLRAVCPCVECKGGHANMGAPPDPSAVRDAEPTDLNLERVEAVGSYALQFFWSDGHWTGIYTWDLLRAACPCEECLTL